MRTKRALRSLVGLAGALALAALPQGPAQASTSSTAYLTGYSVYDNDPPGSTDIAFPVIHSEAAGVGTYADPSTAAVGLVHGKPRVKPGTRFYVPAYRRYFIIEDSCEACTAGRFDVWVDGRTDTVSEADKCMDKITGHHTVILNPAKTYRVVKGAIARNHTCIKLYGETP